MKFWSKSSWIYSSNWSKSTWTNSSDWTGKCEYPGNFRVIESCVSQQKQLLPEYDVITLDSIIATITTYGTWVNIQPSPHLI